MKIPCEDCIILPICICKVKRDRTLNIYRLVSECSLLFEFWTGLDEFMQINRFYKGIIDNENSL